MATESEKLQPDAPDRLILAALQDDAWVPQAALVKPTGLSLASLSYRVARIMRQGLVRRVTAVLDPDKLGFEMAAFVEVFIEPARHEKAFISAMENEPEVQEVHHVTGEFSLMLKVRTRNRDTLQRLLLTRISSREGVRRTRTVVVLSTPKEETALPLAVRNGRKETR